MSQTAICTCNILVCSAEAKHNALHNSSIMSLTVPMFYIREKEALYSLLPPGHHDFEHDSIIEG